MAAGVVSFIAHYLTLYSCYASIIAYLARFFCLSPVNTYHPKGGAEPARAAYRLHQALIQLGVDSKMLVQARRIDDRTVMSDPNKVAQRMWKARPVLDALPLQFYRNRQSYPARLSVEWLPDIITSRIAAFNPD